MPGEVTGISLGEPTEASTPAAAPDQGTLSPLFDLRLIDDSQVPAEDQEPPKSAQPAAEAPANEPAASDTGKSQDDLDAELVKMMMGGEASGDGGDQQATQMPPGVDEATWQQFQAWQQQQQAGTQQAPEGEQQPAAAAPAHEGPLFKNEDEFEAFFSDQKVAEEVLGRVAAMAQQNLGGHIPTVQAVQQHVNTAVENAYYAGLRTSELMLYVHDAGRDTPQIYEHPKAFDAALSRVLNSTPDGDPEKAVKAATESYMRAYRSMQGVEQTVQSGRRVDVRGEQKPPNAKSLPRQSDGGGGQPDAGTLNPLFALWRKAGSQ